VLLTDAGRSRPGGIRAGGTGAVWVVEAARPVIAGRYRLSIMVGTDAATGAQFWRALDTVLARDVGLSVLRRTGEPR
jgi:hypothetical protein